MGLGHIKLEVPSPVHRLCPNFTIVPQSICEVSDCGYRQYCSQYDTLVGRVRGKDWVPCLYWYPLRSIWLSTTHCYLHE